MPHIRHKSRIEAYNPAHPVGDGAGQIVVPAFARDAAKESKRVFMAPDNIQQNQTY